MLALLGALALVAEAAAERTAFFSAGFACVLAAALVPGGGFGLAALILAASLLARTLICGGPKEGLADLLAGLAATFVAVAVPAPLGPFTGVALWLGGWVSGKRSVRDQLLPQAAAVGFAGLLLARLEWPAALLLVPVLAGLQLSATATLLAREERDKLELQLELARTKDRAEEAHARAQDLAGELSRQLSEKGVIEELSRGLLEGREHHKALQRAAAAVVRGARVEIQDGSTVVTHYEGQISPEQTALLRLVASHGALALRSAEWADGLSALLSAYQSLAGTLEPAALRARLEEQLARLIPARERLVVIGDEECLWPVVEEVRLGGKPHLASGAMGAPMGSFGVLAVKGGPYTRRQLDLLHALALEAATALENSRLHHEVVVAHAQFRQAQVQLVQASKLAAVGQLAAGVAHELNTPLGAMMMVLEWLQVKLADDPGLCSKVETALRSGRKLQNIIDKLLHYSRSDPGLLAPLRLAVVVKDTLELVGSYLNKESIAVEVDIPAELTVVSNPNELQQVLTNLLLNARDALKEAPTRKISLVGREGVLTVSDTGPGIAPEDRERVFDPFFTTKPVGQGTGLGLSLSREIVGRHGGTLELGPSSAGASFVLTLPQG